MKKTFFAVSLIVAILFCFTRFSSARTVEEKKVIIKKELVQLRIHGGGLPPGQVLQILQGLKIPVTGKRRPVLLVVGVKKEGRLYLIVVQIIHQRKGVMYTFLKTGVGDLSPNQAAKIVKGSIKRAFDGPS